MKVPAECPGEQSKEEKKKLKAERQEAANATRPYKAPTPTSSTAELPALSRRDTMNSLSSGYAASATRSTSALSSQTTDTGPTELPATVSPAQKPTALRKHRIVAPPPDQYVSAPPPISNGGTASRPSEPRGKMLYPYQANGEDEISVDEGQDVVIVEPDVALYDYEARTEAEWSMTGGDKFVLINRDSGNGWADVEKGGVTKCVPANYIEDAS
ncbi:hypothetical protein CIHG_06216 [Coccidioides immitis H538.4]|uniref:SH3 domain-containing protein n=1 Tax=Coccidioides immitis H538.4 TaxID=396776 RepID=A0A0J8RV34_COCIT|nr:hypothetical protein CIHG_06216 [Coccidioides immitis H538.4]